MSSTTLTVLSVLLAVVIIAVLAAALIVVRQSLAQTSSKLGTLADALETVESEHLKVLEPAVKAINEQFDIIVAAFPGIAAKAKIVAERRPS
jgi:type II secretory pathway component PulJ